jgi:MFS transporter, DHA1 family, multidrug resistance protein
MAALMLVISISPFLAPLAGASLLQFWGWRAIFAILTIVSLASLLFQALFLTENVGRRSPGAPFGTCPFSGP